MHLPLPRWSIPLTLLATLSSPIAFADPAADAAATPKAAPAKTPKAKTPKAEASTVEAPAVEATQADATAAPAELKVVVDAENGTFELAAKDAPLGGILEALSTQGEFELISHVETGDIPVTLELPPTAWPEGLESLLEGWHYALQMDPEGQKPAKLVILSGLGGQGAGAETAQFGPSLDEQIDNALDDDLPLSSLEEATRIAEQLRREQEDPVSMRVRQAREAAEKLAEARAIRQDEKASARDRLKAAYSEGAASRDYADALLALGRFTDPQAISDPEITYDVVGPAIKDSAGTVRLSALQTLRNRGLEDSKTLDEVRNLISNDPEPAVRREALEVYALYGDRFEVLSDMQKLGREPGPVRDLAVREWIRIEKENQQIDDGLPDKQVQDAMN